MPLTIDQLADQYLNYILVEKGLAKKTIESYSRDIVRFLGFLNKKGIDSCRRHRHKGYSSISHSSQSMWVGDPFPGAPSGNAPGVFQIPGAGKNNRAKPGPAC